MKHLPLAEGLDHYRSHFPGPHLDVVLASMITGNTVGDLWAASQGDSSPLLLLWDHGNNVFYLAGEAQRSSLGSLAATVTQDIRPRAIAEGAARFKAHALSLSLEEHLPSLFPGSALHESRTLFFVHDDMRPLPALPNPMDNLTFMPITRDILMSDGLAYSDYVLAEIRSMWPSEERFYEHGFGIAAVLERAIICWCTAEYVSPTWCGIGIETSPRFERRGVATSTARHFVREARARGITACWECAATNGGSVRVAEKSGFMRKSEETYWIGSFA